VPKASDLQPGNRFVGLFIGPKHSGKTVAACSFPQPLENWDFDGRINGLLGAPWIDRAKITYDSFPPREQGLIDRINKKCDNAFILAGTSQFDTKSIVLDSITSECIAMITQAKGLTHIDSKKGRFIGPVAMAGPDDYNFESTTAFNLLAFFRSIPVRNVIVTGHTIDKYGKINPDDPYSESIVIGEKLALRDKIAAGIGIYFDHIFRFDRRIIEGKERFFVKFRSELACTSYSELPDGEIDITGKHFYNDVLMHYLKKEVLENINVFSNH
jgi:hypothetical protein